MIIVTDKAKGLAKAATLASELQRTRKIQGWHLSDEVPGIVLSPYPATSGVAKESGGNDKYRADLLSQFATLGYKLFEAAKPEEEKVKKPESQEEKPTEEQS